MSWFRRILEEAPKTFDVGRDATVMYYPDEEKVRVQFSSRIGGKALRSALVRKFKKPNYNDLKRVEYKGRNVTDIVNFLRRNQQAAMAIEDEITKLSAKEAERIWDEADTEERKHYLRKARLPLSAASLGYKQLVRKYEGDVSELQNYLLSKH